MTPTVEIKITRDRQTNGNDWEETIAVSVEITRYYKGTNYTDDPTEIVADEFGYDDDGQDYELTMSEREEAQLAFWRR